MPLCSLIVVCGEVHYSHVAARAALHLLLRFLDVEKNKDASYFLDVLLTLDLSLLKRMQLHQHIISERGNRLTAFRLIHAYRCAVIAQRASVMATAASVDVAVQMLIGDGWAVKEYYRWSERRTEGVVMIKGGQGVEVETTVPNLTDVTVPSVLHSTLDDVLRLWRGGAAGEDDGWKDVRQCEGVLDVEGDVRLHYRRGKEGGVCLRMQMVMHHPAPLISAVIADLSRRKDWDVKYHTHEVLARLTYGGEEGEEGEQGQEEKKGDEEEKRAQEGEEREEEACVLHYTYKSFASPYKYRDVLLLTAVVLFEGAAGGGRGGGGGGEGGGEGGGGGTAGAVGGGLLSPVSPSPSSASSASSVLLSPSSAALSSSSPSTPGPPPPPPPPLPAIPPCILHLLRSVQHPSLPETKQRHRAAFHSSAYIITPLTSTTPHPPHSHPTPNPSSTPPPPSVSTHLNSPSPPSPSPSPPSPLSPSPSSSPSTLVTLLLSCDKEAVLIVSADLLGETNELRKSFVNLQRCVAGEEDTAAGSGGGGGGVDESGDGRGGSSVGRVGVGVGMGVGPGTQRPSSVLHSAMNGGDVVDDRVAPQQRADDAGLPSSPPVQHSAMRPPPQTG